MFDISGLTLEEKASLLSGHDDWYTEAIERAGIPAIEVGDGPHGLRKETGVDMVWVPATGFPTASAMGASWDRDLVRRVAVAIGEEARAEGVQVVLGPGVNMKRSPLCGRNFEYFSEDPLLSGELGTAYVQGIQSVGVGSSLKHFAANNQEIERTRISVEAADRTLREIYLAAFERVVKAADPWTVMCSYNRLRGVHASENRWLLTTVLREEWGYDGVVVSDWNAVHHRVRALAAGLDLEMPGAGGVTDAEVVAAVKAGELDESVLDASVERILGLVARSYPGPELVNGPVMDLGVAPGDRLSAEQLALLRADEHHDLAREAAAGGITLLRNENGVLPLDPHKRIAVVGAFAAHARIQGGGSSGVDPTRVDNALDALAAEFGDRLAYAPGYVHTPRDAYQDDIAAYLEAHGAAFTDDGTGPARRSAALAEALRLAAAAERVAAGPLSPRARTLIDDAVEVARDADVIVVFAGLPLAFEQEADDRTTLALPADQVELIGRLAGLPAPLVVVLSNGSAVTMDPWHDRADAIVEAWLPGQAGAGAVADVLMGRVNPSGKVAETFPLAVEDTPGFVNWTGERGTVLYGEGVFIGYRWYDALRRAVRYPFGHGLSYTTFAYGELEVDVVDASAGVVRVSCTVTNTGPVAGREVVQLYVGDPDAAVRRPERELRGFDKVTLDPGASARVTFDLVSRDFAYWDVAVEDWRREGGEFVLEVGASSRDIRLRASINLPDDPAIAPLVPDEKLLEFTASRFTEGHR
ncbi:glycoside hydrolase family 3 C-terminal domain-containing protein [Actinoplanes sp. LDG1-06]|uniref:Glycoside hydrolase family 3 C-terminal domain-containing protein n=1 Tax=Paractinoplanes ovalisporus TaxID=2810368 RepID=A0ABS2A5H5_9ACTN|nr:glycoside hydrolase family 3 C-terminal domain-containing protein [Actinoplanes ovalisporus]MBM2615105.1 glycoside hydrolase family 3 C-terminal domain-containing protein [Actinoplanes ovalisporus]